MLTPLRVFFGVLSVWVAGAVAAAAVALFTFGPAYFRHTLSAIFDISRDVGAAGRDPCR